LRHGTFYSIADVAESQIREAMELVRASGLLNDLDLADDDAVVIEFNIQQRPVGRQKHPILFTTPSRSIRVHPGPGEPMA
jgi:hypothetical protein